jgi:hypothetical protein
MLAPNLDPGSSAVEIGPAAENAIPATARFFSVQSIALSCFWSRGSVVRRFGSPVRITRPSKANLCPWKKNLCP